ncbi:fasciclin domain-containing protein [Streptomyces sp. NEAU-H3]|uniref:fasciclin domain-containing protein n=1 Tax=Streptomyces sp. NEAU-H3 TaxID=2720636 RepID=UPI00143B764C|nr:fasciclin domain-containing protein [Streptomyces sp. NEAU-H3]NJA59030.1 fasciclin domain-containing protein [Streptomyces sp. NEAU-H3]
MNTALRRTALALAVAVLPVALTACSGDSDNNASDSSSKASSASKEASDEASSPAAGQDQSMDAAGPFGAGCAGVPKSGAGSFDGMAQAGLVDTLNNAKDITVFAPTNDAFAKIPKADLDKVLADKAQLTKILTYHVVGKKLTPKNLEKGTFETLEKSTLMTSGSGTSYKVNDSAKVVCGNVRTANANVYIIDSVLMPKM